MVIKRILGTAVRHPIATTGLAVGVAKGTLGVVRRVVRGQSPLPAAPSPAESRPEPAAPTAPTAVEREPEVVRPDPIERDLPEPVVIEALDDDAPTPDPEGHVELEEELVWTSESSAPSASE